MTETLWAIFGNQPFQFIQNKHITPHHFTLLIYSWIHKS